MRRKLNQAVEFPQKWGRVLGGESLLEVTLEGVLQVARAFFLHTRLFQQHG